MSSRGFNTATRDNFASTYGNNSKENIISSLNNLSVSETHTTPYSLDPGRPPVPTPINYSRADQTHQHQNINTLHTSSGIKVSFSSINQAENILRDTQEESDGSVYSEEEEIQAYKTTPTTTNRPYSHQSETAISMDTSRDLSSTEVPLSEDFKKRRDEWAERGAAKIMKEYKDPETGETKRQVISKGIKDFKFGKEIGDGSYSTVVLATSTQDPTKNYAVKILNKAYLVRQKKVKYVNIEKEALQRLNNSRSVIKMYFTFQDENSLYFLLEYAPNGDFLSLMKKYGSLSEECTRYYSAQIIDAIEFLHLKGIIHRDIKPENILLDQDFKVKLTDFGTAKILYRQEDEQNEYDLLTRSKSFVGTAEYVSPELLNDSYVDYKCDIWAYGCIVYQMIAGKPPFKASNEYLTFQKVMKVQYAFTAGFPLVVRDLVKKILIRHPERRLEISDIKDHFFFNSLDFNNIWDIAPPPISPYKISAKSMAPIPELNKANSGAKPPTIVRLPKRPSNATLHTTTTHASPVKSTSPSGQPGLRRSVTDPKTREILENARRSVASKKQANLGAVKESTRLSKNGRGTSSVGLASSKSTSQIYNPKNAAVAAVAALSKKPVQKAKSRNTTPPALQKQDKSLSIASSKSSTRLSATKKIEDSDEKSPWAAYMRPNEKVIRMGDICMVKLPTSLLQKILGRKSLTLKDFESTGGSTIRPKPPTRPSFLSQVARSGVTGFRDIGEDDLYVTERLEGSFVADHKYEFHPVDLAVLEEEHTSIKKIFNHSLESEEEIHGKAIVIPSHYYENKLMLITSLGRCLIFVKSDKSVYHLQYKIFLNQPNVELKEISSNFNNLTDNYHFVMETPFQSFLFECSISSSIAWITCLQESTKSSSKILKKPKPLSTTTSGPTDGPPSPAVSTASSRSVETRPTNLQKHTTTGSSNSSRVLVTESPNKTKDPAVKKSTNKQTSNQNVKKERIFDSYVSMRQKKHNLSSSVKPVETSVKLVNGLPLLVSPSSSSVGHSNEYSHISYSENSEIPQSPAASENFETLSSADVPYSHEDSHLISKLDTIKKKFLSRNN